MDGKSSDLAELRARLSGGVEELVAFCGEVHLADLAEWLQDLEPHESWRVFTVLDSEARAELLDYAEDTVRAELVGRMSDQDFVDVVHEMQADDVADLLALTDEATTERVLHRIDFERAQGLRQLIDHPADTAGGLMTTEFITVSENTRLGDAIKEIKKEVQAEDGPSGEEGLGVWVVDADSRPVGFISDRDLLSHSIHDTVEEVMETDVLTVGPEQDQEEVAQLFRKYGMTEVPVVDKGGALIGVVTQEYAREVLEEEAEEDMMRLAGTSPDESTRQPVLKRVRNRLPMQPLTVLGGLSTAAILNWALKDQIGAETRILTFIPLIIGLAGNVGIQSSTVLVRAFATGEIGVEREASVLASEVLVGLVIGILCGLGAFGVLFWTDRNPDFGFAVGAAISVATTWAAFLGSGVTILCQHLKIDPAVVAGPFLISLSDVSGCAIFVTVAKLFGTAG
jgi:magnesium transporter